MSLNKHNTPIMDHKFIEKTKQPFSELQQAAIGDEEQCIRVNLVAEFPVYALMEGAQDLEDAIETLQRQGATVITSTTLVKKDW